MPILVGMSGPVTSSGRFPERTRHPSILHPLTWNTPPVAGTGDFRSLVRSVVWYNGATSPHHTGHHHEYQALSLRDLLRRNINRFHLRPKWGGPPTRRIRGPRRPSRCRTWDGLTHSHGRCPRRVDRRGRPGGRRPT
ncbi:hypothetical protein FRUB_05381 [Fimbriiglobus ruber]|uniref:Uncharacterized protein n=1 Tax=Fimbriiglobus ruber TaxID=1908690 RepID=A0A225DG55_9BACT|nr:hypothetical protein FRUB_05381 [Fimbriiglobus ruber]